MTTQQDLLLPCEMCGAPGCMVCRGCHNAECDRVVAPSPDCFLDEEEAEWEGTWDLG